MAKLHKVGTANIFGFNYFKILLFSFQLRYYDSHEDIHCKGFIDLQEVISASPIKNVQGAPKKADENAFFEVGTFKLAYSVSVNVF
jgi:myotubularin-related protein 5/13